MIYSLLAQDPSRSCVSWWKSVKPLRRKSWAFEPGLNILWGPNGSGKSTMLLVLSRMFHCWQGGVPVVTQTSMGDLFDFFIKRGSHNGDDSMKDGVRPEHDGSPCVYVDPSKGAGAFGSGAFDDDFMREQICELTTKGSSGEMTNLRLAKVSELLAGHVEVRWTMDRGSANDVWRPRLDAVAAFLEGDGKKERPTVLLDEPDRSLDIPTQVRLWQVLPGVATQVQVIVATHSPLAVDIAGANYVELVRGYRNLCKKALKEP